MKQLQRVVAAVSRITLRQRMHLVFAGYRRRFMQIGASTLGMQLPLFGLTTLLYSHLKALHEYWVHVVDEVVVVLFFHPVPILHAIGRLFYTQGLQHV